MSLRVACRHILIPIRGARLAVCLKYRHESVINLAILLWPAVLPKMAQISVFVAIRRQSAMWAWSTTGLIFCITLMTALFTWGWNGRPHRPLEQEQFIQGVVFIAPVSNTYFLLATFCVAGFSALFGRLLTTDGILPEQRELSALYSLSSAFFCPGHNIQLDHWLLGLRS